MVQFVGGELVAELHLVQPKISAALQQKFLMTPLLHDPPAGQHDDLVGAQYRRQPVGNDKGRPAVHQIFERFLHSFFRSRVQ